jgi:multiple sugar transport system substrate-binding protein
MTYPKTTSSNCRRALLLATISSAALFVAASSASAQTITVWSGYPELVPFYEHVAEGMKDEFPDLTVEVNAIALREHERRVALGITSGESAEVLELATSIATRYLENGLLATPPEEVQEFVNNPENFDEFFVDAASYDGTVYGVPLFRGQSALYYNTDMLEAAGLEGPPTTMEEIDTYAEALTERDANGNPTRSGWSLRLSGGGSGITEKFAINMFQHGGEMLEAVGEDQWRSSFATEAGLATLKQYLHNLHETRTVTVEMPADAEAFEREQTAMFMRESWVIGDIASKAPDLSYATATLPRGSIVNPVQLYVAAEGEQADAAWDYVLATQEPENLLWLLDNIGWLPNRANLDYSEIIAAKPAFEAFVSLPESYEFFTTPAIGPIDEVMTRAAALLQEAFANPSLAGDDEAIMNVLENIDTEVNAILSREGLLAE